ncbi:hypothetical protein BY996DRAFT_6580623 [Phakopsora pachyrhizi]|nr:hypothetical protein BY996DRAFT_6580623 [Phakopsora pachyrhizi]
MIVFNGEGEQQGTILTLIPRLTKDLLVIIQATRIHVRIEIRTPRKPWQIKTFQQIPRLGPKIIKIDLANGRRKIHSTTTITTITTAKQSNNIPTTASATSATSATMEKLTASTFILRYGFLAVPNPTPREPTNIAHSAILTPLSTFTSTSSSLSTTPSFDHGAKNNQLQHYQNHNHQHHSYLELLSPIKSPALRPQPYNEPLAPIKQSSQIQSFPQSLIDQAASLGLVHHHLNHHQNFISNDSINNNHHHQNQWEISKQNSEQIYQGTLQYNTASKTDAIQAWKAEMKAMEARKQQAAVSSSNAVDKSAKADLDIAKRSSSTNKHSSLAIEATDSVTIAEGPLDRALTTCASLKVGELYESPKKQFSFLGALTKPKASISAGGALTNTTLDKVFKSTRASRFAKFFDNNQKDDAPASLNYKIETATLSEAEPQKNTSGHLTTEDYSIICMWLSKPSNFSACFGRPPASKENGYALMAAEVNRKSKSGLNISSKQMKEWFKTYKAKYVKAKKLDDSTGFGVSEDDQSKGIITISQKLNNLCPCFEQMDVIFGSQPNITPPSVADTRKNSIETVTMVDEHIDENLPNLGESPFDNAGNSQNNTFEEREEGIETFQDHSDNNNHDLSITSNLSSNVPPESTPTNNTSGKRKASNSLNLSPESHKRGPKSTLASSYAELYKSKVTKLNWEQQKWHLEKEQKDKERHMELAIREKEIQFAKDGKDKELEVKMLIADKDREAMKLKQDDAMLLAVVGSSRSIEEIAEISKILFNR